MASSLSSRATFDFSRFALRFAYGQTGAGKTHTMCPCCQTCFRNPHRAQELLIHWMRRYGNDARGQGDCGCKITCLCRLRQVLDERSATAPSMLPICDLVWQAYPKNVGQSGTCPCPPGFAAIIMKAASWGANSLKVSKTGC